MPEYRIKHITRYTYPSTVIDSANQVMLFPLEDAQLEIKKHDLIITQHPTVELFTDYFGNKVGIFSIINPHNELTIESIIEVITYETLLPANEQPAAIQWEHLTIIREQLPYMDFMWLENFESYDEIATVVKSLMNESITPFAFANQLSALDRKSVV